MAYIPLADVVGGLGSGFSGASRDIMAIQQARQLEEMRRLQMEQDQAEEARRQAEESRRQAAEAQKTALRPLELATAQYGVRGQILGTVATPEEYDLARGEIDRLGLPSSDLPAPTRSTAWATFKAPEERRVISPSLPKGWVPPAWLPNQQNILPAPADLPEGPMMAPGIAREDLPAVQRAAERGLPLEKQEKFRDADVASMLRSQELASRGEKYRTQLEYADRNADLAERRFGLQETKDERAARLEREKIAIDREKLAMAREAAARESNKEVPKISGYEPIPEQTVDASSAKVARDAVAKLGSLETIIKEFKRAYADAKRRGVKGQIIGPDADRLNGIRQRMLLNLKEAENLGVLQAVDIQTMEPIVPKAVGAGAILNSMVGRNDPMIALDQFEREAKGRLGNVVQSHGYRPIAKPGSSPKVGDIKTFPNGNKGRWNGSGWEKI